MGDAAMFLAPIWFILGLTIVVCGLKAGRDRTALELGCVTVAILWVAAGAVVNAALLLNGASYSGFADGAPLDFVRDTWESLVVPHQAWFIGLLVAFEALTGLLVLVPGRPRRLALVSLIAFTFALVAFGWGFLLWSVPIGAGLTALLRVERRRDHAAAPRARVRALTGR